MVPETGPEKNSHNRENLSTLELPYISCKNKLMENNESKMEET
jgi:hypothetical protein